MHRLSIRKLAKAGVEKRKVVHENHYWQKEKKFRNLGSWKIKIAHVLQKAREESLL